MSGLKNKVSSFAKGLCPNQTQSNKTPGDKEFVKSADFDAEDDKREVFLKQNPINLNVNGKDITLDTTNISATTSLATYLRTKLLLTGTKVACGQGGCGSCAVKAEFADPASGRKKIKSVNACLTPILKCDGWSITTTEGIGSTSNGLDSVQSSLVDFFGTQCGFCSPGMVMAMRSLLDENPSPDREMIERALDGQICRCTGYRPILDAFFQFAAGSKQTISDIEDLITSDPRTTVCPQQKTCSGTCKDSANTMQYLRTTDGEWMKPGTLNDLLALLESVEPGTKYRLVAGNTGTGVYANDGPYDLYVDISVIPELTEVSGSSGNLQIGGGVPISDLIEVLEEQANAFPEYAYCVQVAEHLKNVANTNVRNVGSLAGNLMLKHAHPEFPSDLYVLLESVNASVGVRSSNGQLNVINSLSSWLSSSMDKNIVQFVSLPPISTDHIFYSYKISPRKQNAHAYVNAAFLFRIVQDGNSFIVADKPNMVYGGISSTFDHATSTELLIEGVNLNDTIMLQSALQMLDQEVKPDEDPVLSSPDYRKHLTQALFYKFVLHVLGPAVSSSILMSGSSQIERAPSSGAHAFETDPSQFPVNESIVKYEGQSQVTGQARFADDEPPLPNELFAHYVLAKIGNCDIQSVNIDSAMILPGVIDFVDYRDIPGTNSYDGQSTFDPPKIRDELFCTGHVHYAGQPIGLILADTMEHAKAGAKAVEVTYMNKEVPVVDLEIAAGIGQRVISQDNFQIRQFSKRETLDGVRRTSAVAQGEFRTGAQYHFYLENHVSLVRPLEEGEFEVISSTQHMDKCQFVVAKTLGIDMNMINIKVKRVGGGYGGKVTRAAPVSAACAVAANKRKVPVRLVLDLEANMEMHGKRPPYIFQYSANVGNGDKIESVELNVYADAGFSMMEPEAGAIKSTLQNGYYVPTIQFTGNDVITNTPGITILRAPFLAQSHALMETMMEHMAFQAGLNPLDFRMNNLLSPGDVTIAGNEFAGPNLLPQIVNDLKASAGYEDRQVAVDNFNASNAWKKKGLSLIPMRWPMAYFSDQHSCQVAIYSLDGTVSIIHGGIEVGQGINTRVSQVVAKTLGIPLSMVSVKASDSFIGNNNSGTNGSRASMLVCASAVKGCQELRARMKPIEDSLNNPSWLELVQACKAGGIDLTARSMTNAGQDGINVNYDIYAAVLTEVELDVLTGEKTIRRVDMIEDTGQSVNPEIDVGQIEGAFTMGLGLWLTEEIKYDPTSGRLLTRDTWEYKPPANQDIPEVFNLSLYNSRTNPCGTLGSKSTGEPPVLLAFSVMLALRNALNEARKDVGLPINFFEMDGPASNEYLQKISGITPNTYYL